jgi:hypothetical protein
MDINPFSNESATIKAAMGAILPTAHLRYTGTATTYAIFMFYNSLPEVMASGKNHVVGVYRHLFPNRPRHACRHSRNSTSGGWN